LSDIKITLADRFGRRCASSGSRWEPVMGYSRGVRSGNFIAITGTIGINADGTYPPTLAEQTRRSLDIITVALVSLGGRLEHVLRSRIYATDISRWEEIASIHGRVFGEIRPATTLVEVQRLVDPEALVEIEIDAIVP